MLQRSSEGVGLKKKLHERQQTPTLVSEREIWWATSEAPRVKSVGRVAKPLKPPRQEIRAVMASLVPEEHTEVQSDWHYQSKETPNVLRARS
jgi:hypothetical protein